MKLNIKAAELSLRLLPTPGLQHNRQTDIQQLDPLNTLTQPLSAMAGQRDQ